MGRPLAELGVAFERIDVGGEFGFDHIPGYLSVNHNKRIPTIDDNGLVLWESNVIVRSREPFRTHVMQPLT